MPRITLNEIAALQSVTTNIRNVCFLAHVDHGKTTLSDHLISWNGIISSKNAGDLRYLDSRPDEQERQITMKASSISLVYTPRKAKLPFLVNLVDSPGHVDFSNEVSTAVRLCDGALVLVDVVEGICVQTVSVLKQAWSECVRPVLVLNKMDKLITELNMSAMEAYVHIDHLIGRVNALVSTFSTGEAYQKIHDNEDKHKKKKKKKHKKDDSHHATVIDTSSYTVQLDEESQWFFAPNKGNVIFCSAKHKWGFTIDSVAQYYHKTKKMNRKVLVDRLWGNYYFYKNDIHKKPSKKHILPMFVEFILDPIWSIYRNVYLDHHRDEFQKWIKKLKVTIPPREIDNHKDALRKMIALMSRWMPISKAVLDTVIKQLPSPAEAQQERLPKIWNLEHLPADLVHALKTCDRNYKDCVVYIPKMVHVNRREIENALSTNKPQMVKRTAYKRGKYKALQQQKADNMHQQIKDVMDGIIDQVVSINDAADIKCDVVKDTCEVIERKTDDNQPQNSSNDQVLDMSDIWQRFTEPELIYFDDENDDEEGHMEAAKKDEMDDITILNGLFIGVGRIYCGTICEGSNIHVFGPRHHDGDADHHVIGGFKLFHFMGKDIGHMERITAGNICGIGGIHDYVQKTGFVSTCCSVPMVGTISTMSFPVVRVAIEASKYQQRNALLHGLKLLNKCDTGVEILVQSNGEYVICASGELHLARCLRDLRDTFAVGIEVDVSEALVSFKESIIGISKQELLDRALYIDKLEDDVDCIETVFGNMYDTTTIHKEVVLSDTQRIKFSVKAIPLKKKLIQFIASHKDCVQDLVKTKNKEFEHELKEKLSSKMDIAQIVCIGCNLLFIKDASLLKHCSLFDGDGDGEQLINLLSKAIQNGFQSVTARGPLCGEAMYGVGFIVDHIEIVMDEDDETLNDNRWITTTIMTGVAEACCDSFLSCAPRVVQPMYRVFIQGTTEVLGSIYDVIQKRKGKITGDCIVEGTNLFDIYALLPVVQSFGFCDELRTETAGNVVPQLTFSHWSIIDEDPLWIPITQQEQEEYGNISHKQSNSAKYKMDKYHYVKGLIQNIRKRKGLKTEIQTVESAEKQSTRSRKK
eukprot:302934_1